MAIDVPVRVTGRPAVQLRRGRIPGASRWVGTWPGSRWRPGRWRWPGSGWISLIEIGASTVVLGELSGSGEDRQRRALRLIGGAFLALAAYLTGQSVLVLVTGYRRGATC